nr:Chain B, co-regulator peptide [synthetic construct]4OKW_B Chain B, co-regulator peptide [synthetic construct]
NTTDTLFSQHYR